MATDSCHSFCCSPFVTYSDPPLTKTPDLQNEIHPLFARERFTDQSIDYSLIELPLRLISQWLTLDAVVRLIVVMADGELKVDVPWKQPMLTDFEKLDELRLRGEWPNVGRHAKTDQKEVGPKMRERARELLLQAVGLVRFSINVRPGSDGLTKASKLKLQHDSFPRGCKSTVFVGKNIYEGIERYHPRQGQSPTSDARMWHLLNQYNLAQQLIHETFHALENLFNGIRKSELFYEDLNLAEAGYAVENAIFGGTLIGTSTLISSRTDEWCTASQQRESSKPAMTLIEWPSGLHKEMYEQMRLKIGVRKVDRERSTTISRVPLSAVEAMFTNDFWQCQGEPRTEIQLPVKGQWFARWNRTKRQIEPWMSVSERASAPSKLSSF